MALIPPFFADCVVAVGLEEQSGGRAWAASGFLYGHYIGDNQDGTKRYGVYLVTNRHVFQNLPAAYLRFNPEANEPAREYRLPLRDKDGALLWFPHPNDRVDVAVIPIDFQLLREQAMQVSYFRSDEHVANLDKLKEIGVTEGDFVYVLGFPMGLIGGERNTVIVRSGSIARIRDALAGANQEYLVDAFIFPGNSGGPIVSKPEALSIKGTKPQEAAYLIGITRSYVSYRDVAVSMQSKRQRVVFEENSGLAAVHPIDFAQDIIKDHLRTLEPEIRETESQVRDGSQ